MQWVPEHKRDFVLNLNVFILHTHPYKKHSSQKTCHVLKPVHLVCAWSYYMKSILCLLSLRHFRAWCECHSVASCFSSVSKGFCSWICQSLFFRHKTEFSTFFWSNLSWKTTTSPHKLKEHFLFLWNTFNYTEKCNNFLVPSPSSSNYLKSWYFL